MCKDVECTFVILKGRWRILKSGVQIYGVDSADYVWFTCCALHNWLLDIDGLSEKWIDTDNWLRNEKMDHRSYPVWCQTSKTVKRPLFGLLLPPPVTLAPLTTRSTNGGSAGGVSNLLIEDKVFLAAVATACKSTFSALCRLARLAQSTDEGVNGAKPWFTHDGTMGARDASTPANNLTR